MARLHEVPRGCSHDRYDQFIDGISIRKKLGVLKSSEIWSTCEGRKAPWYRKENDDQSYGKPNRDCFKFLLISLPTLRHARTYANHDNSDEHHRTVLHSKKAHITLMNGALEIFKKIVNNRGDKIEPKTNYKLDVQYGCRCVPDPIIEIGIRAFF